MGDTGGGHPSWAIRVVDCRRNEACSSVLPSLSHPLLCPHYLPLPSQCGDASVSTITLHDSVVKTLRGEGPVHHMILGPACTVATEPVAEFSGRYINVNQVCGCGREGRGCGREGVCAGCYVAESLLTHATVIGGKQFHLSHTPHFARVSESISGNCRSR